MTAEIAQESTEDYQPDVGIVSRLNRDLRKAAATLTTDEARYLVDLYYTVQEQRIRNADQMRRAGEAGEPNAMLRWAFDNFRVTEEGVRSALHAYVKEQRIGRWLLSIHGIGPVIAAGMMAHLQIERWICAKATGEKNEKRCTPDAPHGPACRMEPTRTASRWWRFAGLDPTVKWEKGTKRPWNASLKVLCWKAGQSFMKLRNSPNDFYGRLYEHRKAFEINRNELGLNAKTAEETLRAKKWGNNPTREHLEAGKLPPAQIDARARRHAVKIFLAHFHEVAWRDRFGTEPPVPFAIGQLGHADKIEVPNWPIE